MGGDVRDRCAAKTTRNMPNNPCVLLRPHPQTYRGPEGMGLLAFRLSASGV